MQNMRSVNSIFISIVDGFRSNLGEPRFYNCDVAIRRSRTDVIWYNHRYTASSSPKACIRITEPTKKQTDLWSQARAKTPFIVAHTFVNLTRARAELVVAGVHGGVLVGSRSRLWRSDGSAARCCGRRCVSCVCSVVRACRRSTRRLSFATRRPRASS